MFCLSVKATHLLALLPSVKGRYSAPGKAEDDQTLGLANQIVAATGQSSIVFQCGAAHKLFNDAMRGPRRVPLAKAN